MLWIEQAIRFQRRQAERVARLEAKPLAGDRERGAIGLVVRFIQDAAAGDVLEHPVERAGVRAFGIGIGADERGDAAVIVGEVERAALARVTDTPGQQHHQRRGHADGGQRGGAEQLLPAREPGAGRQRRQRQRHRPDPGAQAHRGAERDRGGPWSARPERHQERERERQQRRRRHVGADDAGHRDARGPEREHDSSHGGVRTGTDAAPGWRLGVGVGIVNELERDGEDGAPRPARRRRRRAASAPADRRPRP